MGVGGRGLEVCGSGGGRPRLPIPNSLCACGLVNDGVGGKGWGRGGQSSGTVQKSRWPPWTPRS